MDGLIGWVDGEWIEVNSLVSGAEAAFIVNDTRRVTEC